MKPKNYKTFEQVFAEIDLAKENNEIIHTELPILDSELDGGFFRKEMIILGAASGVGKSILAAQFSLAAVRQGYKVGYFSLEISNEMIVSRLLGAIGNIKPVKIRMGYLTGAEETVNEVSKTKLLAYNDFFHFYDNFYSLDSIIKEIKLNQFDFVVVDFIQNIMLQGDEYTRLSAAALQFQKLAKETNSCILVCSQMSNAAVKEGSKQVLEYKGSGSIATVCDLGFVITKTEWTPEKMLNNIVLTLKKNRRGISGQNFELEMQLPGGHIKEAKISTIMT
jgi:replicative DNA helicase